MKLKNKSNIKEANKKNEPVQQLSLDELGQLTGGSGVDPMLMKTISHKPK